MKLLDGGWIEWDRDILRWGGERVGMGGGGRRGRWGGGSLG